MLGRVSYVHEWVSLYALAGLFVCVSRSLYVQLDVHEQVSLYASAGHFMCMNRSLCMHEQVSLYALAGLFYVHLYVHELVSFHA